MAAASVMAELSPLQGGTAAVSPAMVPTTLRDRRLSGLSASLGSASPLLLSAPGTSRLTSRTARGDEEPVKENVMLICWRFIIKLKRKVARLVGSLHKKSIDVHRLLVTRFPILSRVPPALMQQLCVKAQKKIVQRKYTLIQQNCVSEWLYLLQHGSLAIWQQSEFVLSTNGGVSIGINENGDGAAALAMAAASRKFESLHIAHVSEGDEVGLYGLLRPPTIVLMERRKKREAKPQDVDSSSDEEKESGPHRRGHRRRGREESVDYRSGYPQPHTVIATSPSVVFAISARLFREMLLSVPELYIELREEMTQKYLVRLKRFEQWEIQNMRKQKVKEIQSSLIEHSRKVKANGSSISPAEHSASLRQSFEHAESLVARWSLADLFHGKKQLMTTHVVEDDEQEVEAAENERARPSHKEESVLISQWAEKQAGLLHKISGRLSDIAPHHPAPNYGYMSILSQSGALGNTLRAAPLPFVNTHKLVGSRGEFNPLASIGAPSKHQITTLSTKAAPAATALASHAKERVMEHTQMLLQQSATGEVTEALASTDDVGGTKLEKVYTMTGASSNGAVQLSDGSWLTPAELSYQRRLLKIQSKMLRKAELERTREEEQFLEDIMLVSKQMREINKKNPAANGRRQLAKKTTLLNRSSPAAISTSSPEKVSPRGSPQLLSVSTSLRPSRSSSPRPAAESPPPSTKSSLMLDKSPQPTGPVPKARNVFVSTLPPDMQEVARPTMERLFSNADDSSPRGPLVSRPAENPEYAHLATLPSAQIKSLFAMLSDPSSGAASNPALLLLNTVENGDKVKGRPRFDPLPTLDSDGYAQQFTAVSPTNAQSSLNSPTAGGGPPSPKRATSVLLDLSPVAVQPRPMPPPVSKYDLDAPFGSTTSIPASFQSLAFHSFADDAWRGIARVPTPPLVPPTAEDPRKVAIRQGIERARFRVSNRSRESQVGFKEFSRGEKKSTGSLKSVMPDRRTAPELSLVVIPSPIKVVERGAAHRAMIAHTEPTAAEATQAPTVLSMFSSHRTRERQHRAMAEEKKQEQLEQEARARKKALHAAASGNESTATRPLESRQSVAGFTLDGDAGTSSGVDDDEEPGPLLVSPPLAPRSLQWPSPGLRPAHQLSSSPDTSSTPHSSMVHHPTFLSDHHRRVLSGFAPGMTSSSSATDLGRDHAQQAARDHARRVELLKKDRLKPAPGVDIATLRRQIAQEAESQLGAPPSPVKHHPHEFVDDLLPSSSLTSPSKFKLSASSNFATSLASPSSHPSAVTGEDRRSSLSSMLAQFSKTSQDLANALPSLSPSFDNKRGSAMDPADRAVIDALTLPAHKLNARGDEVAGRLTNMLRPFARGADIMVGRGIRIPDYTESPTARAMLHDFQFGQLAACSQFNRNPKRASEAATRHSHKETLTSDQLSTSSAQTISVGGRHLSAHERQKNSSVSGELRGSLRFLQKASRSLSASASLPTLTR